MLARNDEGRQGLADDLFRLNVEQPGGHGVDEQDVACRAGDNQAGVGVVDDGLGVGVFDGLRGVAENRERRSHFADFVIFDRREAIAEVAVGDGLHAEPELVETGDDVAPDVKPENRRRREQAQQGHEGQDDPGLVEVAVGPGDGREDIRPGAFDRPVHDLSQPRDMIAIIAEDLFAGCEHPVGSIPLP